MKHWLCGCECLFSGSLWMGLKDAWVPRDRPAAVELEAAWVQTQSSACSVHYSSSACSVHYSSSACSVHYSSSACSVHYSSSACSVHYSSSACSVHYSSSACSVHYSSSACSVHYSSSACSVHYSSSACSVHYSSSACSVHYSVQSDGRLSSSRAEHGGLGELGLRTASVTSACYRTSDEGSFFSLLYFDFFNRIVSESTFFLGFAHYLEVQLF